jgi:hypothetical protein
LFIIDSIVAVSGFDGAGRRFDSSQARHCSLGGHPEPANEGRVKTGQR